MLVISKMLKFETGAGARWRTCLRMAWIYFICRDASAHVADLSEDKLNINIVTHVWNSCILNCTGISAGWSLCEIHQPSTSHRSCLWSVTSCHLLKTIAWLRVTFKNHTVTSCHLLKSLSFFRMTSSNSKITTSHLGITTTILINGWKKKYPRPCMRVLSLLLATLIHGYCA